MRAIRVDAPTTKEEVTLMIARAKEKKERLANGKKPQTKAEWHDRSKHMIKWFHDNPTVKSFISYVTKHKFTWSKFKKWEEESEIFADAMAECIGICLERREGFLETNDELCKIFIEEQPLYNPMLADYKEKMARIKKEDHSTHFTSNKEITFIQEIKETPEGREFKAKQIKKGKE